MNEQNENAKSVPKRSRRQFIQESSLLVAGGAVASSAVATKVARAQSVHPYGDETIRIGLIGAGGRGTGAANQAMNTQGPTRLVAVADAFEDKIQSCLRGLSREHADKLDVPPERQFAGLNSYQNVLACDVDLIILATPPGFRPLHFAAAIDAGKHVFTEKPLAVDAPGVRQFLKANEKAKATGLAVAVGLQRHHEPRYIETIKRLQDGAIGDIILGRAYWNSEGLWVRPRLADMTEMEYQLRNWYYFNWLCGDHIVEQHIHNIDVINWLKNAYPVSANGQGGREIRTGKEYGQIFDHHFVEFTYADGSKMFSQCRHIKGCWNIVAEFAHGTKGTANISGAQINGPDGNPLWSYGRGGGEGHQQEHHDLFAALRRGEIPNEGEYGAMSTMTAILGRMATYSGKSIEMDEALNSELVIAPVDQFTSFEDTPPVLPDADGFYPAPIVGQTQVL